MAREPKGVPEPLSQTADEALAIKRSSSDGRPVGIKDIARALGISIGTVDRAIHGRGGINAITKERVLKMAQNLGWATGYNIIALPLAAGVLYKWGIMLSPAMGAVLMSLSTIIVAINAKLLKMK